MEKIAVNLALRAAPSAGHPAGPLELDIADAIRAVDTLDACNFDPTLLAALRDRRREAPLGLLTAAAPSFQAYATTELEGCGKSRFPTFSVTGPACALMCEHCQAHILEPMIPATRPEELDIRVRELISSGGLRGFLLSGGSNRRNEIAYGRYLPVIEQLKREFPYLQIAAHTGLMDRPRAVALADAGVDTAMIDIIGADETIRDVYHLDRTTDDFEASLAALCATSMKIAPHIVIGLHYGRLLGESRALEIVARYPVEALVLVVVMPIHARPGLFATPSCADVGNFFMEARARLPGVAIQLGCARPHGLHRRTVDAYAVMAGLDGIAFPSEGTLTFARKLGRPIVTSHSCCGLSPEVRARNPAVTVDLSAGIST